jgi:hypothetical protein
MITDISKECSAFMFMVKTYIKNGEDPVFLQHVGNHSPYIIVSYPSRPESLGTTL